MEPVSVGVRLASSAVVPLIKKLFASEGSGAGLVDKPVRLSSLVTFKGEKRTLTYEDLHKLAAELIERALQARGPHDELQEGEREAVTDALTITLHGLGDLGLDDVEAVRLGHERLAYELYMHADGPSIVRLLGEDLTRLYSSVLDTACLHILHFFTQRSTFVARTLVEQTRQLDEATTRLDILIERIPARPAVDAEFEDRYTRHMATKHSRLTIYGIDLNDAREWPLDTAYLSLEAAATSEHQLARSSQAAQGSHDDKGQSAIPDGWVLSVPQPVEHALAGHNCVLLRGVAGSGKTTLVQWLAVATARQDDLTSRLTHLIGRVPFVLPLRTLTRHGGELPTPDRFLATVGCPLAGVQPAGWAERILTTRRGLLLIDGIDEIPEQERERTRHWLRDLLEAFPGNLWLVTSRPSAVRDDWLEAENFTELTLSPMNRTDVTEFVRRWHVAAGADTSYEQALLTAIRTKQDLGRLATNPLMCP
ncbi:NACHT N-terminal Helical domain 1-containing protein [Streptomyces asiaticus]|uniref:NACHT N-terminal Helical domain 1-containing protein n=1 Tax=Streptomyces asiaticus TaxID=114695 RepID=UPI003F674303